MRSSSQIYATPMLVICVLCCGAAAETPATAPVVKEIPAADLFATARSSFEMAAPDVQALEERLKANPEDAVTRAGLLGHLMGQQFNSAVFPERRALILWMIRNRPADSLSGSPYCQITPMVDPEGYVAAEVAWKQLAANASASPAVLGNAADFLSYNDPAASAKLLRRAESADPENWHWPRQLADLQTHLMSTARPVDHGELARFALAEYEKALSLCKTPWDRFLRLEPLPNAAFDCGDDVKAAKYAKQLLAEAENFKSDRDYGNAIFKANLTLGRVALAAGDIDTAKARLLDAGKTPGSFQLDNFGPSMELARELLQKGETATVLQYLDLCGKFWKPGTAKLDVWKQAIRAGGTPDFSENLNRLTL
jgi:hypothetical protein